MVTVTTGYSLHHCDTGSPHTPNAKLVTACGMINYGQSRSATFSPVSIAAFISTTKKFSNVVYATKTITDISNVKHAYFYSVVENALILINVLCHDYDMIQILQCADFKYVINFRVQI